MYCKQCGNQIAVNGICPYCGAQQGNFDPFVSLGDLNTDGKADSGSHYEDSSSFAWETECGGGFFSDLGDFGSCEDSAAILMTENQPVVDYAGADPFNGLGNLDGSPIYGDDHNRNIPAAGGFRGMDSLIPGHEPDVQVKAGPRKEPAAAKQPWRFVWKGWMTAAACCAAVMLVLLCLSPLLVINTASAGDVDAVQKQLAKVEKNYLDENGYVQPEDAARLVDEVYTAANKLGEVTQCEKTDLSVYMVLDNGLGMHYYAPLEGVAASGSGIGIFSYQPYYEEFAADSLDYGSVSGYTDSLVKKYKNGTYPKLAAEALGALPVADSPVHSYYDRDVTIDRVKQLQGNSVIIWVGHGGYSSESHSTLLLTVEYSDALYEKYRDDFDHHRLEIVYGARGNTVCVTYRFFDKYLAPGALENSIIYLGSCYSGYDNMLVATLIKKGASAVYWNSDAIYQQYNNRMCRSVMEALCTGATAGQALTIARNENGEKDNIFWGLVSREVRVYCTGDEDITLQELYNRIRGGNSTAEPDSPTTPTQPPAVDNSRYYDDAISAYAKMLSNGVMLRMENGEYVKATHYRLLDMNSDGLPEIIVYAVKDYMPAFEIYTYKNSTVKTIADSLDTCDLSRWYNASHYLYIYDGKDVYAGTEKATVAYSGGSTALLKYDGTSVKNVTPDYSPREIDELIDNSQIVGGIQIGSSSDALAGKQEVPPETKPGSGNTMLTDGTYYGLLTSWNTTSMTVEMLEYAGRHEHSYNYILNRTGQIRSLDISGATVWLEWPWGEDGGDVRCSSITSALDTEIWGGDATVREYCTMEICFTVQNGMVSNIVILYAA